MNDEYKDLEADFLKFATEKGMVGIKGHRSVERFPTSCYNAMPKESVQALIDCMQNLKTSLIIIFTTDYTNCPRWVQ